MNEHSKNLTPQEAGERLQVSISALAQWRMRGEGPAYWKQGGVVRYPEASIEEFIQASMISGAA